MKYNSIKAADLKKLSITIGENGVNLTESQTDIKDGELSIAENMYFSKGKLATRPAIKADIANILGAEFLNGADIVEYGLTDAEYYLDGEYCRIATAKVHYDNSNYFVKVYLINSAGSITEIGTMNFARVDSSTYFIPENITFYVGKPQKSSGIFALVSLVNTVGFTQKKQAIYEFDSETEVWCENTDYYIPVVTINGRGNGYELAKANNTAFTANPCELESLNLLNGKFYAYFSSDGYSSSFKLPFSQIADDEIILRLNHDKSVYTEWRIDKGETSATLDFYGDKVTMNVDRESGIIYFTAGNTAFALPQMIDYTENNIRILAVKEIPYSFENVATCSFCTVLGDKTFFAGGRDNGRFYYTSFEKPLYFPQIFDNCIGSPKTSVNALFSLQESLIAFKENEVWKIDVKKGKTLNKTSLLRDNSSIFTEADSYTLKPLSRVSGCKNNATVQEFAGSLIWLCGDRNIYSLSGSKVFNFSEKIKPFLEKLSEDDLHSAKSAIFGDYYMLSLSSKAVIINLSDEFHSAFLWKFPNNYTVLGTFSFGGKPIVLCQNTVDNTCFTAEFSNEKDILIKSAENGFETEEFYIESHLKSKGYFPYSLCETAKLCKVCLYIEASSDMDIQFISGNNLSEFKLYKADLCADNNIGKLKPNLKCDQEVYFTVKSATPFSLGKTELYFNKTN